MGKDNLKTIILPLWPTRLKSASHFHKKPMQDGVNMLFHYNWDEQIHSQQSYSRSKPNTDHMKHVSNNKNNKQQHTLSGTHLFIISPEHHGGSVKKASAGPYLLLQLPDTG